VAQTNRAHRVSVRSGTRTRLPRSSASPSPCQDKPVAEVFTQDHPHCEMRGPVRPVTDAGIAGLLFQASKTPVRPVLTGRRSAGADPAMLCIRACWLALVAAALTIALQASAAASGHRHRVRPVCWYPAVAGVHGPSAQFLHSRDALIISVTFCSPRSASCRDAAWRSQVLGRRWQGSMPASTSQARGKVVRICLAQLMDPPVQALKATPQRTYAPRSAYAITSWADRRRRH